MNNTSDSNCRPHAKGVALIALQAMTPNAIAEHSEITRQAVSKHLRILAECEMLKRRCEGRKIYYQLEINKVKEVDQWLDPFRKICTLLFDLVADKEKNALILRREFAANRQLVWDCYTKSELLDQWFAPAPLTTQTKSMDFSEGGHWHYAMVDPKGTAYWSYTSYLTIKPIDYYISLDAFSNEAGEINHDLPRAEWLVVFRDQEENTLIETVVKYQSPSDLERVIEMGVEQGIKSILEKLDQFLVTTLYNQ
eukprot:gene172-230_t